MQILNVTPGTDEGRLGSGKHHGIDSVSQSAYSGHALSPTVITTPGSQFRMGINPPAYNKKEYGST
jgi:hypothetical protein